MIIFLDFTKNPFLTPKNVNNFKRDSIYLNNVKINSYLRLSGWGQKQIFSKKSRYEYIIKLFAYLFT